MIFAKSCTDNPLIMIIILVAFFGLIVAGVIWVKKNVDLFKNEEKPTTPEEAAKENLDRLLQPVEDEKTAKAIKEYKQKTIVKDEDEGEDKPIVK